jgi:hypothetical protein
MHTSALPKTTMHNQSNLMHDSFPFSTSTSALPKITLYCEENLTCTRCCPIMKESTSTSEFPTTTLHDE